MRVQLFPLALGLLCAVSSPLLAQASFSDQTIPAGVAMTHMEDPALMANPMIAGGAAGDFNRDGWPDLYVIGGGGTPDRLFLNNGDGTFRDEAAAWGLSELHHGSGCSAADFNNDGWLDIYVTSFGPAGQPRQTGQHRLYRNNGNGSFSNVAAAAGVHETTQGMPDGYGSAWGDYDLDGDLDLFVTGWEFTNGGNRLFQNNGDETFTDVTSAAGVFSLSMKGFAPTFADMDGDLYPELIAIADAGTSRYYINNGDGTFTRLQPNPSGFGSLNGMGVAIGDLNDDGLLDFYGTSVYWGPGSGNMVWFNQGDHVYLQDSQNAGVDDGGWGWAPVFLDCNRDGMLDIAETNGWATPPFDVYPSKLFVNQGDGTFSESSQSAGLHHDYQGRGMLNFDYDLDGDQDLVIFANQDDLKLFRNDCPASNGNTLRVTLDTSAHSGLAADGIGTRLKAVFASGQQQIRYMDSRTSYLSQSELAVEFGVGLASQVDELWVQWADGSLTVLGPVAANQSLRVASGLPLQAPQTVSMGTTATVELHGANPGEWVMFLHSFVGPGPGRCKAALGGLCYDMLDPVFFLGSASADPSGVASLPVTIPPNSPEMKVTVQGIVPRGLNGSDSVKSNARVVGIVP
ncbi:MAG: CRTAC1 family protein [Planctomycetota bacterium]|nr:MAG: CRTAC1 family protein [Planctomycetota bacterium]